MVIAKIRVQTQKIKQPLVKFQYKVKLLVKWSQAHKQFLEELKKDFKMK